MLKAAPGSISPADAEPIIAQDLVRVEGKACVDPSDRRCRAVMAVGLAVATGRIFSRMPIRNAIPELFNSDLGLQIESPASAGLFLFVGTHLGATCEASGRGQVRSHKSRGAAY